MKYPCVLLRFLAVSILTCVLPAIAWSSDQFGSYDRGTYYSQPMGYSIWKAPPASVEQFARLVEQGRLNATTQQYAQSLHEAGFIPAPDSAAAVAFVRNLKEAGVEETKAYRMSRILRSYRTGERKLDSTFYQILKAGERGYFDDRGQLVIRLLCLNVVYPERAVAVVPPPPAEPGAVTPPAAPAPEAPVDFRFNPPPQFEPPARENQQPVSPSAP